MPTDDIRGAGFVWEIKAIKLEVNFLNGYSIKFPISFVLKSRRNGRYICWEKKGKNLTAMNLTFL
jgi:hypothetical protein